MSLIEIRPDDALIVVDVQPDFMPGGALAVPGGDEVLPVVNHLLRHFPHAVATQDWHPPDHASFASQHAGMAPFASVEMPYGPQTLWPDHCLQGTAGAALHPELDTTRIHAVIRKGVHRGVDSYSGFFENDQTTRTGLEGYLRERGVRRVFLCGLATDYCVAFTAEHAARLGFETLVVLDACRGIGLASPTGRGTTVDDAIARLRGAGVSVVTSGQLHPGPRAA